MNTKIITRRIYPAVQTREWDYAATTESYEPGDAIGRGETPEAARADLLEQLEQIGAWE